MIDFQDFSFQYQGAPDFAVRGLSFHIAEGEFIGITGSSGAGKTTLVSAINGIVPHHYHGDFYGSVKVCGADTVEVTPEQLSRSVGSVFQDIDGQMVTSAVEDEVRFGLENFGVPQEEVSGRIQEALKRIGIAELRNRTLSSLSGGQKQKVAIAAIVALKPKILVLDEPTGELDPQSSLQIFEMLRELNQLGITVVVVEQKIMLLCEFAQKLLVMDKGRSLFFGPVQDVLRHETALEESGVHCPRVVSLANQLQSEGLYQGPLPVNVEEACRMVQEVERNA